jgi:hypothetical protein
MNKIRCETKALPSWEIGICARMMSSIERSETAQIQQLSILLPIILL